METKTAFKKLINTPTLMDKLKVNPTTARVWKMRYKQKKLSLEKMELILKRAGFQKIPEQWGLPIAKVKNAKILKQKQLIYSIIPAC